MRALAARCRHAASVLALVTSAAALIVESPAAVTSSARVLNRDDDVINARLAARTVSSLDVEAVLEALSSHATTVPGALLCRRFRPARSAAACVAQYAEVEEYLALSPERRPPLGHGALALDIAPVRSCARAPRSMRALGARGGAPDAARGAAVGERRARRCRAVGAPSASACSAPAVRPRDARGPRRRVRRGRHALGAQVPGARRTRARVARRRAAAVARADARLDEGVRSSLARLPDGALPSYERARPLRGARHAGPPRQGRRRGRRALGRARAPRRAASSSARRTSCAAPRPRSRAPSAPRARLSRVRAAAPTLVRATARAARLGPRARARGGRALDGTVPRVGEEGVIDLADAASARS